MQTTEDMTFDAASRLAQVGQLTSFVWRSADRYELMLRAVSQRDDMLA